MRSTSGLCGALPAALILYVAGATALAAQPPGPTATLVKDINTSGPDPTLFSSSPRGLTAVGSKVFFTAAEASTGMGIWVSDGTSAGTQLLRTLGPEELEFHIVGPVRNMFLWATPRMLEEGVTLMASDGTRAGTLELFPGSTGLTMGSPAGDGALAGDLFYFSACQGSDCRLWTSDGTTAGTRPVPGSPRLSSPRLAAVGRRVYFQIADMLWISDGTAAGTHAAHQAPDFIQAAGDRLYFFFPAAGGRKQLWTSDGTAAGSIPLTRFATATALLQTARVFPAENSVFFLAEDAAGRQLWTSDGTVAGTRRLIHFTGSQASSFDLFSGAFAVANGKPVFITPDSGGGGYTLWTAAGGHAVVLASLGRPTTLQAGNQRVYFAGSTTATGVEPWVSDGTSAGTHVLVDLCPGACSGFFGSFVTRGSSTFFPALGGLWQTDGTATGTRRVIQHTFSNLEGDSFEIVPAGGRLFLSSSTAYGRELWVHDADGDRVVADIFRGEPGSRPQELQRAGNGLIFTACDGSDRFLWQSPAPGAEVTPIRATAKTCLGASDDSVPWNLTPGDLLYFLRKDDQGLYQLWRSDGSEAGTFRLTDLPAGVSAGGTFNPGQGYRTSFHGKQLFSTYGASGQEVWETDGTVAGTRKAAYVPAGLTTFSFVRAVGDELYFFATEGPSVFGLWRSDGTLAGTRKIAPLYTTFDRDPQYVRLGGAVFFLAEVPGFPRRLWRTDGTQAGTQPILDVGGELGSAYQPELALFQGHLFVFALEPEGNEILWRSDGTVAGTTQIKVYPPEHVARSGVPHHSLTAAGGQLFFVQADDEHGTELWRTDGTPEGTVLVKDLFPGSLSSEPDWLTPAGDRLFFAADDPDHGIELWESDGAAAGTQMVQDLAPERLSSRPDQLTVVGDRLYFTADDGETGRELWTLPLTGPTGCQPSSTRLCLGGRYQVEAAWRDFQGHTGIGTGVPLTADTGYFWFFDPANVETVVKVLDGGGVNGHVWVFYGALSNVEYTLTVTDTESGLSRRYFNPLGQFASVGDIYGFGPLGAFSTTPGVATAPPSPPPIVSTRIGRTATQPCEPGPTRLCLHDGRFAVDAAWRDFQGHTGDATAVPLSGDTGTFWFFDASNVELVVKALDGRPVNGHFWLFYGALSNVEYTLTVTDTETGTVKTYHNPSGRFASVGDASAF